jgi:hypothetical protein
MDDQRLRRGALSAKVKSDAEMGFRAFAGGWLERSGDGT